MRAVAGRRAAPSTGAPSGVCSSNQGMLECFNRRLETRIAGHMKTRRSCFGRLEHLLYMLGIIVVACSDGSGEARSSVSAAADAPIHVEASPILTIGGMSETPGHTLDQVVTPFLLPDGAVAVPLTSTGEIRIFNPDGVYRSTLGGKGQGPGEFQYLMAAWPRADTIEALDLGLRRITRFLPSGQVETIELTADVRDLSLRPGPLGSGWFVGGVVRAGFGERDAMEIHAVNRAGAELGKIADLAGFIRVMVPGGGSVLAPLVQRGLVSGAGDQVFIIDGYTGTYEIYDSSRALLATGDWFTDLEHDPGEATREVLDSVAARAGPERGASARSRWGAAPVPDQVSKVAAILGDSVGFVWVLPFDPIKHSMALGGRAIGGHWRVIGSDGQMLNEVEMPDGLQPTYIGGDALVGIARDSLGVESVRVHRIKRR